MSAIVENFQARFSHPAARCHGITSLMYPEGHGAPAKDARNVCLGCPARDACLEYAIVKQRATLREVAGCGTNAGYMRHFRSKTVACVSCKEAHAAYVAEGKQRQRGDD